MLFLIDFHGTITNNPTLYTARWKEVIKRLPAVTIWSGDPEGIPDDWKAFFSEHEIDVVDKGAFDYNRLAGAIVIDDEPSILAMVVRKGAIAVPAAWAGAFFNFLGV